VRGEAYLALHQALQAASEFKKLLDELALGKSETLVPGPKLPRPAFIRR
jgi:hypothetical protein